MKFPDIGSTKRNRFRINILSEECPLEICSDDTVISRLLWMTCYVRKVHYMILVSFGSTDKIRKVAGVLKPRQ
jgi:hypothetical protein